jgi:hypothetical protein
MGGINLVTHKFLSVKALDTLLWVTGITFNGYYSESIPWAKAIYTPLRLFFTPLSYFLR